MNQGLSNICLIRIQKRHLSKSPCDIFLARDLPRPSSNLSEREIGDGSTTCVDQQFFPQMRLEPTIMRRSTGLTTLLPERHVALIDNGYGPEPRPSNQTAEEPTVANTKFQSKAPPHATGSSQGPSKATSDQNASLREIEKAPTSLVRLPKLTLCSH